MPSSSSPQRGRATPRPVRERTARTPSTRQTLLLTAERLFARHGIDGVSLREINRHANQKNASAIHYHFGSRDAVIEGLLRMRAEQLVTRRRELLGELLAQGAEAVTVRSLLAASIRPQIEALLEEGSNYHYNRFLAQGALSGHPELREVWRKYFWKVLADSGKILQKLLPDVPPRIFRQRYAIAVDMAIYSLASIERLYEERGAAQRKPFSVMRAAENLTDMLSAALSAPLSPQTVDAMGREKRRPKAAAARGTGKTGARGT